MNSSNNSIKPQNINPTLNGGNYNNNTVHQDEISEYDDDENEAEDDEIGRKQHP